MIHSTLLSRSGTARGNDPLDVPCLIPKREKLDDLGLPPSSRPLTTRRWRRSQPGRRATRARYLLGAVLLTTRADRHGRTGCAPRPGKPRWPAPWPGKRSGRGSACVVASLLAVLLTHHLPRYTASPDDTFRRGRVPAADGLPCRRA